MITSFRNLQNVVIPTFFGVLLALLFLLPRLLFPLLPLLLLLLQSLHLLLDILLVLLHLGVVNFLGQYESPRLEFRVRILLRTHLLAQTRHYQLTRG